MDRGEESSSLYGQLAVYTGDARIKLKQLYPAYHIEGVLGSAGAKLALCPVIVFRDPDVDEVCFGPVGAWAEV